jgi:NAD-dependent deacetylase
VVYPAAGLPLLAARNGAPLAIVNNEETPHDEHAVAVVRASAGETLTAVLRAIAPEAPLPVPRPS